MRVKLYHAKMKSPETDELPPETVAYKEENFFFVDETLTDFVVDKLAAAALHPALELEEYDYADLLVLVWRGGRTYSDRVTISFTSAAGYAHMSNVEFFRRQIGGMATRLNREFERVDREDKAKAGVPGSAGEMPNV